MRRRARITSNGQITVPQEIRRVLGIRPGDRLLFESDDSGTWVRVARVENPFAKYKGIGNPSIPCGRKAIVQTLQKLRGR